MARLLSDAHKNMRGFNTNCIYHEIAQFSTEATMYVSLNIMYPSGNWSIYNDQIVNGISLHTIQKKKNYS